MIVHPVQSAAFDDYYRSNRETLVRALALSLGSVELGRDAAAEAMTRTFENWPKVRDFANPMGWSYRVGLNWGRSRRRKFRREAPLASAGPGPSVVDRTTLDPRLEEAVRRLPLKHRVVIVLRYYLDWSINDIAAALSTPAGTVKSRLHRALATLETQIGDSR